MTRMVKLERTKADRAIQDKALGGPSALADDGVHLHLEDHHLKALGADGDLAGGHEVHIRARGKVKHTSSDSDAKGKTRRHATLHITHMAMEHKPDTDDERADVRGDVEESYAASEKKRGGK